MEARVICPGCRVQIPDTAAICEHCNTVIDTGGDTGSASNQQNTAEATSPGVVNPTFAGATTATAATASPAAAAASASDEKKPRAPGLLDGPLASSAAIEDLRNEIRSFAPSEKLAMVGAVLLLLGLGLPWRAAQFEPTEIGLVLGGWPRIVALSTVVVVLVHFLRRKDWALPYRDLFLGGAVVASFLAVLGAAAFIKANDVTRSFAGITQVVEVQPREGAYLALLASVLCLAGTAMSLLRRKSLPG